MFLPAAFASFKTALNSNESPASSQQAIRLSDDAELVELSIVVPVFNEAKRLASSLRQIADYLRSVSQSCEVIVVDDGSTDESSTLVEQISSEIPAFRLVRNASNSGKGLAVCNGMLSARGRLILFTDADLSAPITEAERLLEPLRNGCDVVIGSRGLNRNWIGVHQSALRETAGKVFNYWIRSMMRLNFQDTQCGFKAFRRAAAIKIFSCQTVHGFGFDVEVLYLAQKFGLKISEVPVHWNHAGGSKVRLLSDAPRMLLDVFRIRWNDWSGKYTR